MKETSVKALSTLWVTYVMGVSEVIVLVLSHAETNNTIPFLIEP